MSNTVTLHRVFNASPEKVFKAYSDPDAMAWWIPPYGFLCKVHELNFKEGGTFKMSFVNFSTGNGHSFGGKYLKIIPNEFIQHTDVFDDPNLLGEMMVTINLKKVICGTEIHITQEGIPAVIPVEMCYLGWQESMEKLKRLVETDIKDNG